LEAFAPLGEQMVARIAIRLTSFKQSPPPIRQRRSAGSSKGLGFA